MKEPQRHSVFFRRAWRILNSSMSNPRIKRGKHLVFAHYACGDVGLLRVIGAVPKNIIIVAPAEELLEVEERIGESAHLVADDLAGAVRDARKSIVTARLDARGPMTDAFLQHFQTVLAHGMAEDSILTLNFVLGVKGQSERLERMMDRQGFIALSTSQAPPRAEEILSRVLAAERLVRDALGGGGLRWTPMSLDYYRYPHENELYIVEATGPVTRGLPGGSAELEDGDIATHMDANFHQTTEEGLHREVMGVADTLRSASSSTPTTTDILPFLFNLSKERVDRWLAAPPPPKQSPHLSVVSSGPSSSPTSPTGSRRTRLFRS